MRLGLLGAVLIDFVAVLGPSGAGLGAILGRLGGLLGRSWALLGGPGARLGAFLGGPWGSWHGLGGFWWRLGGVPEIVSWCSWGVLDENVRTLEKSRILVEAHF